MTEHDTIIGTGHIGLSGFHNLVRDTRLDGIPFILETPMLSGSLAVTNKSSQSKNVKRDANSNKVKTETMDDKMLNKLVPNETSQESNLTVGASTWKREIELLHALESVAVGEVDETVQRLHGEIVEIVTEHRKKKEETAREKKEAKAAARLANGGISPAKTSKIKKYRVKKEEEEDPNEDDGDVKEDSSGQTGAKSASDSSGKEDEDDAD